MIAQALCTCTIAYCIFIVHVVKQVIYLRASESVLVLLYFLSSLALAHESLISANILTGDATHIYIAIYTKLCALFTVVEWLRPLGLPV